MLLESYLGSLLALKLAEGPLVDDGSVAGVLEKAGCDPGLKGGNEMMSTRA